VVGDELLIRIEICGALCAAGVKRQKYSAENQEEQLLMERKSP
jgi:hypothetical protein